MVKPETPTQQSHLIAYNTLIIWAARILQIFPQFILVPYLIRHIGEAGYGTYSLIWSLMMAIDQAEQSLQQGVIKYSAAFMAQKQIDQVNKVISSSFVYSLLLGILACLGILAASRYYHDTSGLMNQLLVASCLTILLIIPLTPYKGIVQSQQRHYVAALSETAARYLNLAAVVLWYRFIGPSVLSLVIISCVLLILSRLVQVPAAYRLVPGLRNRLSGFDWATFRMVSAFGGMTVLMAFCLIINGTGVRWLLGTLKSPAFVAHLSIMLMPGLLLQQIVMAMTITVMPATSAYKAMGDFNRLREMLIRGVRYSTILVLAGLLAAVILMRQALIIWVGPEYAFLTPYALTLFASMSFMLSTSTAHHMLKGLGKLWTTLLIYIAGLVIIPVGLILSIFQIWQNPYAAVTAGLAAGHLICGCLHIVCCSQAVGASFFQLLVRGYGQPLAAGAVVLVLSVGMMAYGEIEGFWPHCAVCAAAVLLFLSSIYFFIAADAERRQFRELAILLHNRVTAAAPCK